MQKQSENARRFLNTYNQIDSALRVQGDMKRSISYTEAIRRAARTNSIVAKYEDVLIDYGRLRNAIVHSSNEEFVIAEPYTEVVIEYEKIANLICTPPLALETVGVREVKCVEYNMSMENVLALMYKSGYSNLPVYKDGMLIGVANAGKIARVIGKKIYEKQPLEEFIKLSIEEIVKSYAQDNFYTISNKHIGLDEVLNLFAENRKLSIVLITPTGSLLEKPLSVITAADILDINKVLDDFA